MISQNKAKSPIIMKPFVLLPFLIFIGSFILLTVFYPSQDNTVKLTAFPVFSCLIAIIFAFFTFREKVSVKKRVSVFISGSSQPTIIYMCYIFIFSSIFAHILTINGGVDSAVRLCKIIIPSSFIFPGIFATIALFSLTIGSSIGSIATFMPIAIGIAQMFNINPSLLAGIVVSGSMLGDNLSVISDTTIAAIQTTHCNPYKKFKENVILVIPAFFITIGILFFINRHHIGTPQIISASTMQWSLTDLVNILPYVMAFLLALLGLNVLVVLIAGIIAASGLGFIYGKLTFLQIITLSFDGFYLQTSMVAMLILVLLIAGLSKIIEYNGGIQYLLHLFDSRVKSKAGAELAIIGLVSLLNIAIARNTIAILLAGPIAKQIGSKFNIASERIAGLLDIFACAIHGIIPYSSQLLLAAAMANISSLEIIPHLHYQFAILLVSLLSVLKTRFSENKTIKTSN